MKIIQFLSRLLYRIGTARRFGLDHPKPDPIPMVRIGDYDFHRELVTHTGPDGYVHRLFDYWCPDCKNKLEAGPRGCNSVNVVCKKCMTNWGCLPDFNDW